MIRPVPVRILYFCPDIDRPAGGIRRIYRHVEILARNGFYASVIHKDPAFRITWFSTDAPVHALGSAGLELSDDDILVIPEVCYDLLRSAGQAVRTPVAMVLSWAYVFLGLRPGENYGTFGIRHVIAGCEYIRDFVKSTMELDSTVVTAGIDTEIFRFGGEKKLAILCTPRKNPQQLHLIECVFRSKYPEFASVPFTRVEGLPHDQMAEEMNSTAIFLTVGFPEGINRPVLEAMASGCTVVGFHGKGGLEYMRDGENCFRVDDGDTLGAAASLAAAVRAWQVGQTLAMQEAARETALRYSNGIEEEAVLRYWRNFPVDLR